MIEIEHLTMRYKKQEANAVDDVSFTVAAGEFFALLGPNGAGKTTTISILTTSLLPTSGSARVAGHDVVGEASKVRQHIGVIFQKPSLDLNLTAEENVRMHAVLYGLYRFRPTFSTMPDAYQRRIHELAELLGIEKDIFKPLKTFSGGMQRKLEIVRSLMHHPKVLFLDEPTAGLDPASRRTLWEHLNVVRQESETTLFLTTHYIEEAEQADHIAIFNQGRIVSLGTPGVLKAELVREFLILDAAAADQASLRGELSGLGLTFDPGFPVKITLNGHSVQQIVKEIDTPLTTVRTESPSLEEAYLEIVNGPQ
ncbi:MAG: ATP-binding cassette domain-containing protein [Chloroflexi bacterium]|nr:ATP-binding cassette domain-containing protein [Chloroflexota bacterium]MCH8878175.1 ATP-binding cassette domain-containing protein [Chloroflexota bacterium]MDK1046327.1 ATP-binding cassette domain-containing protein [Anaerolineales bacterium]